MLEGNNVLIAFILTIIAGLCTGGGSFLALLTKTTNTRFLSVALGFSAGVMIYISFTELLLDATISSVASFGPKAGKVYVILCFMAGIVLMAIIDYLVPTYENPHVPHKIEELNDNKLLRLGIFSAVAIIIHNFPEGIATFMAAMEDLKLGIPVAFAIALHNIPEGIAVSIPIYFATKSRKKAFYYSFLSGFSEPMGAVAGYFLIKNYIHEGIIGFFLAIVAGIMVYISFDELLPTARVYGRHQHSMIGLFTGMAFIAFSMFLLP